MQGLNFSGLCEMLGLCRMVSGFMQLVHRDHKLGFTLKEVLWDVPQHPVGVQVKGSNVVPRGTQQIGMIQHCSSITVILQRLLFYNTSSQQAKSWNSAHL